MAKRHMDDEEITTDYFVNEDISSEDNARLTAAPYTTYFECFVDLEDWVKDFPKKSVDFVNCRYSKGQVPKFVSIPEATGITSATIQNSPGLVNFCAKFPMLERFYLTANTSTDMHMCFREGTRLKCLVIKRQVVRSQTKIRIESLVCLNLEAVVLDETIKNVELSSLKYASFESVPNLPVSWLSSLSNLETLDISKSGFRFPGNLVHLENLKEVAVDGRDVESEEFLLFMEAKPNVHITGTHGYGVIQDGGRSYWDWYDDAVIVAC